MKQITVTLTDKTYPIIIDRNFDLFFQYNLARYAQCIIITDTNVEQYCFKEFYAICKSKFKLVDTFIVEFGEKSKSLECAETIYSFLVKKKVSRRDIIISYGGGIVGDLGGFVASTFLRGIDFIQIPTSLLAQIDSSIGGKTAVNLDGIKNVIGTFYHPKLVYINYSLLRTLSLEEIRNGLVEVLVHAIIGDEKLFRFVEDNLMIILNLDINIIEELIYRNCLIKTKIVSQDEKDSGNRAILNFGHTFGHAIESYYKYKYRHGECVAIGILGACYIAEDLDYITPNITKRIRNILNKIHVLPTLKECNKLQLIDIMMHDKKNVNGKIHFILPKGIGNVCIYEVNDFGYIQRALDKMCVKKF